MLRLAASGSQLCQATALSSGVLNVLREWVGGGLPQGGLAGSLPEDTGPAHH